MSLGPSTSGSVGPGSSSPRRKRVSREEWEEKLAKASVSKTVMNELVMNYLIIEGYRDAAERFREEAGVEPSVDLATIGDRMATRVALQNGDVEAAMKRANDLDPLILDRNESLFFHLQQQKLIELIREGRVEEALKFAQGELAPRGEENPEFLQELERTMMLLAFEDSSKSPMADLLSPTQRQKTASELNAAILSAQCQEKDPKLPALLKLMAWAQEELKKTVAFPTMDPETGEFAASEQEPVPDGGEPPTPSPPP